MAQTFLEECMIYRYNSLSMNALKIDFLISKFVNLIYKNERKITITNPIKEYMVVRSFSSKNINNSIHSNIYTFF